MLSTTLTITRCLAHSYITQFPKSYCANMDFTSLVSILDAIGITRDAVIWKIRNLSLSLSYILSFSHVKASLAVLALTEKFLELFDRHRPKGYCHCWITHQMFLTVSCNRICDMHGSCDATCGTRPSAPSRKTVLEIGSAIFRTGGEMVILRSGAAGNSSREEICLRSLDSNGTDQLRRVTSAKTMEKIIEHNIWQHHE